MRARFSRSFELFALLAFLVFAGCGKSSPPPPVAPAPTSSTSSAEPAPVAPVAVVPTPSTSKATVTEAPPVAPAPPTPRPPSGLPDHYTVKFVKDGDSVTLDTGEDMRYIGIDTPEYGQPFSDEARALNKSLVEGKRVRVEYDEETRDTHNRVLAYVYATGADGKEIFVNAEMLRRGFARVYPHEKTRAHAAEFLKIQQEVMPTKLGIWGVERKMDVSHFVGTLKGKAYHRPDCKHMKELPATAVLIKYTTREEAEKEGKTPCRSCNP